MRIFLLRERIKVPQEAVKASVRDKGLAVREALGLTGSIVFVKQATEREVPWLDFVRDVVAEPSSLGEMPSFSYGALIVVPIDGRLFAVSFGRGRFLLDEDVIEREFGLKAAAALVDPSRLSSVESRSMDPLAVQVLRQSIDGLTTSALGLDVEHEMLKSVRGRGDDEGYARQVAGSDSVALIGEADATDLGPKISKAWAAYKADRYRDRFAHIDWRARVSDAAVIASLDTRLVEALAEPERDDAKGTRVRVGPPQVMTQDVTYRVTSTRQTTDLPDLTAEAVLQAIGAVDSPQRLAQVTIECVESDSGLPLRRWPLYQCLYLERTVGDAIYVLEDGAWWAVDADFMANVDARLELIPAWPGGLAPRCNCENESAYNARQGRENGWWVFDADDTRFTYGSGRIEVCDLLTPDGAFMHVKRAENSELLSHLFTQSSVSADLFIHLPEFRKHIRSKIKGNKAGLLTPPWAESDSRPNPQSHAVVLGMIRDFDLSKKHPQTQIPLLSRNQFARTANVIEKMGYHVYYATISEEENVCGHVGRGDRQTARLRLAAEKDAKARTASGSRLSATSKKSAESRERRLTAESPRRASSGREAVADAKSST